MMLKDVVAIASDERLDPELRRIAAKVRDDARQHRLAPVGIHVMRTDGELLAKLSVNSTLGSRDPTRDYLAVLAAGLEAWRSKAASRPASRATASRRSY
jgi:hypothetical protein